MPGQIFICLLTGDDLVVEAAVPVQWTGRAGRALLAVLALHPSEPVSRDKLAGILWSESDQHAARASLRMALLSLKRSIEPVVPGLIRATNDTIMLDLDRKFVDWALFEYQSSQPDPEPRLEALDLYKGDLLAAFPSPTEAVTEALRYERERLRETAIETGVGLLSVFEDIGDRDQLKSIVRKILTIEPANEPAHQAMMRAFAAAGDRPAALRQYEQCREALDKHYGLEPSVETSTLRNSIISLETLDSAIPAVSSSETAVSDGASGKVSPGYRKFRRWRKPLVYCLALVVLVSVFRIFVTGGINLESDNVVPQAVIILSLGVSEDDPSADDIRKSFEQSLRRIPGTTLVTQAGTEDVPPVLSGNSFLVEASASRSNNRLRVFVTLRNSVSEESLWQGRRDFNDETYKQLTDWIVTGLVKALEVRIGSGESTK